MEGNEPLLRPEQTVRPNISSRTLQHPSFMSLFTRAGFTNHFHREEGCQPVHPLIPAEVFYSDPTLGSRRIPNKITGMMVSDCSQLNTPPPIMSTCVAPPNRPDLFRFGTQATRDLGSSTWRTHTKYPLVHPTWVILQLTEEEDQAVTNLLKLHHQEVPQIHDIFVAHMKQDHDLDDFHSAEEANGHVCAGDQKLKELHQGRSWSGMELEVAHTLLGGFNQKDEDFPRTPKQCKSATSPLMCRSTGTPEEWETSSALVTCSCTQNDSSSTRFSCVRETEIWSEENRTGCLENKLASPPSASLNSKIRSRATESMRTDLEGDAVHVLLSLKDVVTFDILQ